MEPLLGGGLVNLPEVMQQTLNDSDVSRTPVELALQWLWARPGVSTVLSGMGTLEQVQQNIKSAAGSDIGLTEDEKRCITRFQEQHASMFPIPCTKCGYCMPCPHGVDIPYNFNLYNDMHAFTGNIQELNRNIYKGLLEERRADHCIGCQVCEGNCPQSIPISDWNAQGTCAS